MTDDERERLIADATDKADTKNRLANLEAKVNIILKVAYGAGAWVAIKLAELISKSMGGGQ